MDVLSKTLCGLLGLTISLQLSATHFEPGNFYSGINYEQIKLTGKETFKHLLRKNYPSSLVYVGYQMTPAFSVELGYRATDKHSKHCYFPKDKTYFGQTVTQNFMADTRLRLKDTTFALFYHGPVLRYHTIAVAYLAIAGAKPSIHIKTRPPMNETDNIDDLDIGDHPKLLNKLTDKSAVTARLGIGLQGSLTEKYGYRLLLNYENTARVRLRAVDEEKYSLRGLDRPLRDGMSVSIGLWYRFG